jgi:hypothetical protein
MQTSSSPRLALANLAICLLPLTSKEPIAGLSPEARFDAMKEAVQCARDLLALCNFDDDAFSAGELRTIIARAEASDVSVKRPEWIRLPRPREKCPYSGLTRSVMNELISPNKANGYKAPVRSVSLRKRHAIRGVRLIHLTSLMSYLENQKP